MPLASLVSHLPRGKHRVAHWLGQRMSARVFTLPDSVRMRLNPLDPFQAEMAFDVYQPETTRELARLVRPGDTVLTAGAHMGYFMLKLAQRASHVIGFECDPNLVNLCGQNLNLNPALNATLVPVGLGSRESKLAMNVSIHPGQSSFAIAHYSNSMAEVRVRRGDDVLRELGVDRVDGLLLDLEGWESQALEGLSETLDRHPPRWAIIECFDFALENAGSSREQLIDQIDAFGLRVERTIDNDLICVRR